MSAYRVEIRVMPRAGLLDPQGQAVEHALQSLGFAEVRGAHVGLAQNMGGSGASSVVHIFGRA